MHNTPRSRAASSPDYKVEQDQSCAPSHAPPVGRRVRGRPVGLEGGAQCPPTLKENGSSSAPVTGAGVKSHVSEAFEARRGRGANRLGAAVVGQGRAMAGGGTSVPRAGRPCAGRGAVRVRADTGQGCFRAAKNGGGF